MNLYAYVAGNPVNGIDPLGLMYLDDAYDSIGATPIEVSGGPGYGGGVHAGLGGINKHVRYDYGPSGWREVTTTCIRIGPGWFAGGGAEAGGSIGIGNGGISLSGDPKLPASFGLGMSVGLEFCTTTSCPM